MQLSSLLHFSSLFYHPLFLSSKRSINGKAVQLSEIKDNDENTFQTRPLGTPINFFFLPAALNWFWSLLCKIINQRSSRSPPSQKVTNLITQIKRKLHLTNWLNPSRPLDQQLHTQPETGGEFRCPRGKDIYRRLLLRKHFVWKHSDKMNGRFWKEMFSVLLTPETNFWPPVYPMFSDKHRHTAESYDGR